MLFQEEKRPKYSYNVLQYLNADRNSPFIWKSYLYQYDVYLRNLSYKKIFNIVTLLTFFIVFMVAVFDFLERLHPINANWNEGYSHLYDWDTSGYSGSVTINQAAKD